MESIRQDIRYAARTLARSPGFTIAAITVLTLSVGANTALFTVLEEAVLAEPPFPDRRVTIDNLFTMPNGEFMRSKWSYPRYRAFRDETRFLEDVAGYSLRTMTLTELGPPAVIGVETVTPSFFPVLGITAARGRVFGAEEIDNGSRDMVAMISHDFWQARLGGSQAAVGSTITLNQMDLQVLGVLPSGFDGVTGGANVWVPVSALREIENAGMLEQPWNQHFDVLASLLRQLLTESLLLALVGGALGIAAASLGVGVLGRWLMDALGTGGGRGLQYLDPDGLGIRDSQGLGRRALVIRTR